MNIFNTLVKVTKSVLPFSPNLEVFRNLHYYLLKPQEANYLFEKDFFYLCRKSSQLSFA